MKLVKQLYTLSNTKGILALENSRNKRVLLVRSQDVLVTLSRILKEAKSRNKAYRQLNKDYRQLDIKILSTDNSRVAFRTFEKQYESLGYTFYKSYKAIRYSIKIDIDSLFNVVVKLVSNGKSELIVAYFDTMDEADNFVSRNYPKEQDIVDIKYGDNKKSKDMLKK